MRALASRGQSLQHREARSSSLPQIVVPRAAAKSLEAVQEASQRAKTCLRVLPLLVVGGSADGESTKMHTTDVNDLDFLKRELCENARILKENADARNVCTF